MRILEYKKQFAISIFALACSGLTYAQSNVKTTQEYGKITITQDERIEKIVNYKTQINKTDEEKRFRIQIYNGNLEGAQEAKESFGKKFEEMDTDIVFETPNYKVRIGKFRTRLEADRYLLEMKEDYPSAFIIQP